MNTTIKSLAIAGLLAGMTLLPGCKLANLTQGLGGYPLDSGPLDIRAHEDNRGRYCFEIHNPSGRALAEVRIGVGSAEIPWRSGENMSGTRRRELRDYHPSLEIDNPGGKQLIRIVRIGGETDSRARDASRAEFIGEACYQASKWLRGRMPAFSRMKYQARFD